MLLELERTAKTDSSAIARPRSKKPFPTWKMIVGAAVLAVAVLYCFTSNANSAAYQLEFNTTSEIPFKEELARIAYLVVENRDGTIEMFEDNRFGSAFIDRRCTFRFSIPSPAPKRIFFSPAPNDQVVEITGARAMRLRDSQLIQIPLEQIIPHRQVEVISRTPNSLLLKTLPGNQPPTLELKWETPPDFLNGKSSTFSRILLVIGFAGAATWLLMLCLRSQSSAAHSLGFSPFKFAQFGAAAALILTMAAITKFNAHPDEYLHFEAAKYFVTNWLPPALDDPAVEASFSHYGVSYLQDLDVAYFVIGKLMAVAPSWLADPEIIARLCNVLFFIVLTGWLIYRLPRSYAPSILLISPQIWYVFSYVNGDALALVISLVMVVQLADNTSLLSRYLRAEGWRTGYSGAVLFAVLLALLLMAKRNYYLFLPFIGLVAFWQPFMSVTKGTLVTAARKWAVIGMTAAILYFPIRIGHEAINKFDDARIRVEQGEKFAAPRFKPSELAAGTGAQRLNLRRQGVPYTDLFAQYNWGNQSFQSFCGVYRWMSLNGPPEYYRVMGALYAIFLGFILANICRLSWRDGLFAGAVIGLCASIVLISAYESWIADFQPQGRYLFPILPMIAFLLHRYRESLRSWVFNMLFGCLFACSVYSFVFVGLRNIPK